MPKGVRNPLDPFACGAPAGTLPAMCARATAMPGALQRERC
jgi:hypothetical protein